MFDGLFIFVLQELRSVLVGAAGGALAEEKESLITPFNFLIACDIMSELPPTKKTIEMKDPEMRMDLS